MQERFIWLSTSARQCEGGWRWNSEWYPFWWCLRSSYRPYRPLRWLIHLPGSM